jgi:hypothetical protein
MSNTNGRDGKSISGETGVIFSGAEARFAKYPANGPQAMAMSTSPRATASISAAGGFSFE